MTLFLHCTTKIQSHPSIQSFGTGTNTEVRVHTHAQIISYRLLHSINLLVFVIFRLILKNYIQRVELKNNHCRVSIRNKAHLYYLSHTQNAKLHKSFIKVPTLREKYK